MEVTKYPYSKYQTWFVVIFISCFIIVLLCTLVYSNTKVFAAATLAAPLLMLSISLVYICRKFFFPLLRRATILELDKEKLQYFASNKIIYWKNIKLIDRTGGGGRSGGWSINFVM